MSRGPGSTQRWLLSMLEAFAAERDGVWIPLTDLARHRYAAKHGDEQARKAKWRTLRSSVESLRRAARTLPALVEVQTRVYGGRGSNVLLRRARGVPEPALTWKQEEVVRRALDAQIEEINSVLRAIGSHHGLTVSWAGPAEPVRVLTMDDPASPLVQEYKTINGYYQHPFARDRSTVTDDEIKHLTTGARWRGFPLGTASSVLAELLATNPELVDELLRQVTNDAAQMLPATAPQQEPRAGIEVDQAEPG